MAAAFISHAAAALRRGFLLAGLLAIVAGILGMHIMTGMHGAHALPSLTPSAETPGTSALTATGLTGQVSSHPVVHSMQADATADAAADASIAAAPFAKTSPELATGGSRAVPSASCACQSSCTDMAAMNSVCIPSAAVASLAVPPPGMAPFSLHAPVTGTAGSARPYSYLPGSPSPGDLSISRT